MYSGVKSRPPATGRDDEMGGSCRWGKVVGVVISTMPSLELELFFELRFRTEA